MRPQTCAYWAKTAFSRMLVPIKYKHAVEINIYQKYLHAMKQKAIKCYDLRDVRGQKDIDMNKTPLKILLKE